MAIVLGLLLVGYMFFGRGFAHIPVGPVFIGDVVLLAEALGATWLVHSGVRRPIPWVVVLIAAFMVLGAIRTIPYVSQYGLDALRDGVLWGYAAFALAVYLLTDRGLVAATVRGYRWITPLFAAWLPISWLLFAQFSTEIDPARPGATVPLVFFKAGDMAVHIVGVIAALIVGVVSVAAWRGFLLRVVMFVPLLAIAFISGTANRGALLTFFGGVAVTFALAPKSRNWLAMVAAVGLLGVTSIALSTVSGLAADRGPAFTSPSAAALGSRSSAPEESIRAGVARLVNAGFELTMGTDGGVPGWTLRGGTSEIIRPGAHQGDQFVAVHNDQGPYATTLTSRPFAFPGGEDIHVSVWAKRLSGAPTVEIYVIWYDRFDKEIESRFIGSLTTAHDGTWRQASGAVPSPEDATRAEVRLFEARGRSTIGVDDVFVEHGDLIPDVVPAPTNERRSVSIEQLMDNILSIFRSSDDPGLEGTKQFRLAWWGSIIDYTVFGDRFWTGKGFGINLADDDGFQSTADGSLRAPHNSHLTVLARMGVPGFLLWLAIQAAYGFSLVRTVMRGRRAGDVWLSMIAAWILVYWIAMLIDTSFDPYLEGPQGGIWYWALMGFGAAIARLAPRTIGE